MPGELKNLVALAISSGSSKYHHQQHMQEKKHRPGEGGAAEVRRSGTDKKHSHSRRSKEESTGGGKRFTKLLSKSVGAVSSTITSSSAPSDLLTKRAPVASPESDASSLLNGGSDHASGQIYPVNYDSAQSQAHHIGDDTPKLTAATRVKNEVQKSWSVMNGSVAKANGREREECSADEASEGFWRSTRHLYSADVSRGAETDDETMLSSVADGTRGANTTADEVAAGKAPSTSAITTSAGTIETGERARGWYATRKSYRSVAYKTWTVGAARKLLNSSRSDYDLPPSANSADTSRCGTRNGAGRITDGSVSDGEEKFYNCTYSRSQDDDLDKSLYISAISGTQSSNLSSAGTDSVGTLILPDLNKMKARKCASSDAVTLFSNVRDPNSFLSPVDSVPSTSSDKTSSLSQSISKRQTETEQNGESSAKGQNGETKAPVTENADSTAAPSTLPRKVLPQERPFLSDYTRPNQRVPGAESENGQTKVGNGKSWLLVASSSSDEVWKDENGHDPPSRNGNETSNKDPINRIKQKSGSRSTGDCFSSEDYFKFTLKKRLLQQRQQQLDLDEEQNGGNDWHSPVVAQRNITPPLLALDRDIRAALHNFEDFNETTRSGSPSRHYQVRSSSPTTLASLMAAAQQRWRQQSERFGRRMERASCRAKIEDIRPQNVQIHVEPFTLPSARMADPRTLPLQAALIRIPTGPLSSSSFSSPSSSSSSSMSWMSQSQGQSKPPKQRPSAAYLPLAIAVDANGDREDDWAPNDPPSAGTQRPFYCLPIRNRSKTAKNTPGASSPFRNSDEAMQYLKKELEIIRKKDHQILTQLKLLDAEITRRKSETDALATIRASISEELENGDFPVEESPGPLLDTNLSKLRLGEGLEARLTNGTGTTSGDFAESYLHTTMPPMPKCLEVNFKTL